MFYIGGHPDDTLRLKSFCSRSNASGKSTVSITLETNDPYQLAYALECLQKVQSAQKRPATAVKERQRKSITSEAPLLQLPAPEPGE